MRNPSASSSTSSKTTPCCSKVGIKRGPWTPDEDELLANYIKREGEGRWRTLPKRAGLMRCGKSCRLRWMNYLRPSVKRGRIAPDEEDLILRLHRLLGNRWSLIAGRIPGRTDNEIKNYWNTHLSKKLISQGIDPRTHKPLNLIMNPSSSSQVGQDDDDNDNPLPMSNPISNSSAFTDPENTVIATPNMQNHNQINYQDAQMVDNGTENWRGFDGYIHGGSSDFVENYNDDMFTSFLDSLINENVFANQQQQQQQANNMSIYMNTNAPASASVHQIHHDQYPSAQISNHSSMWEAAEINVPSSMAMSTFGNEQSSTSNHPHRGTS